MFFGWSFTVSCTFVNHDKKGEKMWFLFNILHVRGRNTCFCKGELCFIFLEGTSFSFFFLYTGLVTIFYIHCAYLWYIYIYIYDVCLLHLSLHGLFLLYLYMHVSLCTQSLFMFHTWCLDEFCLSVSERQLVKVYLVMNSLFTKFFKSL